MRWERSIGLVGVHAEGEVGRVIVSGVLDVPGRTMLEKLGWLGGEGDAFRRFCVQEPRGSATASVNLLLRPTVPEADAAFIVMQPDRCHAMSGSNAICVTTALLELGLVPMREPETVVTLETAAGLVRARASCHAGKCERVTLDMPPSFVHALAVPVTVPAYGTILVDVAFGGVFYALLDPAQFGLAIEPGSARELVEAGMAVLKAAQEHVHPHHPATPELAGLAYLLWCGRDREGMVNATVMPPGRLDRSPCGTGSSARLAVLHAHGKASVGDRFLFRSAIGTRFEAELAGTTRVAERDAVLPRISGRGWIFSREEIGLDPTDPLPRGHMMADVWGPRTAEFLEGGASARPHP